MTDLFYHGEETEKRLTAVAHRAAESILRSLKYMLPAAGREVLGLLTVESLWGLCLLAAGWFLTTVVTGPVGAAINLAFLAYGVFQIWGVIAETYALLKDWFWGFYSATTEAELERAGESFAKGFAKGGITLLELVVTHKVFRFATRKLLQKFPPPEKLKKRYREEAAKASEQSREGSTVAEAERLRGAQQKANAKTLERLKELGSALQTTGAVGLGRDVATQGSALMGGVVVAGLIGTAAVGVLVMAVAAEAESKRRRK